MMERRFDMTDFEQSLKDHADQFVMTPSKRVWNGLYNNLHPGSRWPSITVGVVFLFSLIGIGYLNNSTKIPGNPEADNSSKDINISNKNIDYNLTSDFTSYPQSALSFWKNPANIGVIGFEPKTVKSHFVENQVFPLNQLEKNNSGTRQAETQPGEKAKIVLLANHEAPESGLEKNDNAEGVNIGSSSPKASGETDRSALVAKTSAANTQSGSDALLSDPSLNKDKMAGIVGTDFNSLNNYYTGIFKDEQIDLAPILQSPMSIFPANFILTPGISSSYDYDPLIEGVDESSKSNKTTATQSTAKGTHKKRNAKINWMYFINPTISGVSFGGVALKPISRQNLSPIIGQQGQLGKMLYNARIGYAAGTQMSYAFSNKWKFTTGATISYSGYNVISNQVHPTFAYLTLKDVHTGDAYSKSYITHYGNGQGQNQISLKNYSLQASIPIGLEYSLWENSDIKLSIASSLAPSFIIKSNSFIISADGRNYVNDPDLLRSMNLTGNFGAYVTFRANKIKWIIGPDIRYQWLSSYKKEYSVKEHLIDYGIKIGISR